MTTLQNRIRVILLSLLIIAIPLGASAQEELHDPEQQRVTPFQVFDNLYYIGAKWVSSWLLVTDQGLIVFDALYEGHTDILIENIRELGFDPNDIRYLIGSHAHYDHIGGAIKLQQGFSAVTMMTEQDWAMTEQPAVFREYPKPIRHLSANDGSTLNLGRTRLRFLQTPGETPGVLSTSFTVYDNGYPREAFIFGGPSMDFEGVEAAEQYLATIQRLQQIQGIEVHLPVHAEEDDIFARNEMLQNRQDGDPHPFVDPESWAAYLELKARQAQSKLEAERNSAN
ncbi:MAG: MBL fold metallo-hydrolase [Pseudomonadales bacterium]|nr:MBL fold metallo-hydrolase [Pseudomonadales bacterium]